MKNAPEILCLHAITRSTRDFDGFRVRVADRFDTHAPDLLGHGEQRRSDGYRLADYRDAVLDELPCKGDLILWGHSLGGLVSLAVADRLGSRVRAIVLEDVPLFEVDWPRFRDGPFHQGFQALFGRLTQADLDPSTLAAEVAEWPSGHGETFYAEVFGSEGVKQRVADLMALDPRALEPPMTGTMLGDLDIRGVLSRLRCPVHLLAGSRERGSALTDADLAEFGEVCPSGVVHQFPHLAHDIRPFEARACTELLQALAERS